MLSQSQIDAIPEELKRLPQWVGAENKVPLRPKDGGSASVTDPSTWGTFDQAIIGLESHLFTHIGFVFTDDDPYVFIDLDAPKDAQKQILAADNPLYIEHQRKSDSWVKALGSYSERSSSGHGIHIIIRAVLKQAIKLAGTEMYFTQRYAIFTGDVVSALPIADRQTELDQVVQGIKAGAYRPTTKPAYSSTPPNPEADQPILNKLGASRNALAIKELWEGRWQANYPSQSEADFALLGHLAFYTSDDAQVVRIFRTSLLGQRHKANNPRSAYLEESLQKIRQQTPPAIDFSEFKAKQLLPQAHLPIPAQVDYPPPPGVLGEIAEYIAGAAVHPHPEVSFAGAIAFGAGLAGRHFNVSGTGLNQYVMLLAATGVGKEGASDGIDNLYAALRPQLPEIEQFRGPSNFASGAGLVRALSEKTIPCALSVIGEFGLRLTAMSHPQANSAEITLKSALLDFFSKSGEGKVISPVAYSDSAKNTQLLQSPALSILGVSTPETFFEKLTDASVADGLIPRFLTIGCYGSCKMSSETRKEKVPDQLISKIAKVAEVSLYMGRNTSFCHITLTPPIKEIFRSFEKQIVDRMNGLGDGAVLNILNRANLKALRLAALAAVFDDPTSPQITAVHAKWAIKFVQCDCAYMMSRFEKGHVGEGDHRQLAQLREKLAVLVTNRAGIKNAGWVTMLEMGIVPYSLLSQKLLPTSAFLKDKRGGTSALNQALKTLEEMGEILALSQTQVFEKFGIKGKAYVLVD